MFKRTTLFILAPLHFGLLLLYFGYAARQPSLYAQTIPTVTPAEPAATATSPPEPTATEENGSTNPPPANTNTPSPGATSTPSPTSPFAPTPEDGFLPTAMPCADSPTIRASNTLNVRQGPGLNYQIIGQVVYLEVRPIIGRSQYGEWWLIELADGDSGWVADAPGLSQGFMGNVPLMAAPPINGQTPTPGVLWQPTLRPFCTVTPTHTATATPSMTATSTTTVTPTAVSPTPTPTVTHTPVAMNEGDAATRIALSSVTVQPTSPPTAYPPRPTATPLDIVAPASTPNFLPIVGLILVAGGIFMAIARRRFSG